MLNSEGSNCGVSTESRTAQFLEVLCKPGLVEIDSRVAIICAHPDDETIGAGTRLSRLRNVGIVHVTDGAPRTMEDARRCGFDSCIAYAAARRNELENAVQLSGVGRKQLYDLGFADQSTAANLVTLTHSVYSFLRQFAPEFIVTHPYEGGHPDHDATAFAVHEAGKLIRIESGLSPVLLEMTSYHSDHGLLRAGEFLPTSSGTLAVIAWLSPDEQELKQRMFAAFSTQAPVLVQFPTNIERFRKAPAYDFTLPPHPGTLYYEQHPWGITGAQFRTFAADAIKELGMGASLPI